MPKALNLILPPRRPSTTVRWPILGQYLSFLIGQLVGVSEPKSAVEPTNSALTTWADADYFYLEIDLPHGAALESDISISNGKAFIRLKKVS